MSFIGEAIKAERKILGMTSKQLAEAAGLSQQYVSEVQRGTRIPTPETMLLFANVFPDADTAHWLWMLLRDTWGNPIANVMGKHAVAVAAAERAAERD